MHSRISTAFRRRLHGAPGRQILTPLPLHGPDSCRHVVLSGTQCGNVLELRNRWSLPVMAMSTQAYDAFTEEQRDAILRHVADIHHAPIDTLEFLGGGGVRCTLGEVFPAAHA